jgi:hypothetical protein
MQLEMELNRRTAYERECLLEELPAAIAAGPLATILLYLMVLPLTVNVPASVTTEPQVARSWSAVALSKVTPRGKSAREASAPLTA